MNNKLFFENSSGEKICGVLEEPNSETKRVVVVVHGFTSHKNRNSSRIMAQDLKERGINSFRIDLNGCGESEGDFIDHTISKAAGDVVSAVEFLKKRGYEHFEFFGSSAGGLTVMVAALQVQIDRMALKAPVSDFATQRERKLGPEGMNEWKEKGYFVYGNQEGREYRVGYEFFLDSQKNVMYDKAKNISCPVLIIHGDKDESVDIEDSKKVVKNFPDGRLIVLVGADHALSVDGDRNLSQKLFADWFEGKELKVPQPHYFFEHG